MRSGGERRYKDNGFSGIPPWLRVLYIILEMSDILHYLGNVWYFTVSRKCLIFYIIWEMSEMLPVLKSLPCQLRTFCRPRPRQSSTAVPSYVQTGTKISFRTKDKNIYVELYKFDFKVLSLSLCSYQTLLHKVFWNWKTKLFPSLHRPTCCPAGVLQLIGNGSIPFHSGSKDPSLLVVAHKSGYRSKHKGTLMLLSLMWDIFQTWKVERVPFKGCCDLVLGQRWRALSKKHNQKLVDVVLAEEVNFEHGHINDTFTCFHFDQHWVEDTQ